MWPVGPDCFDVKTRKCCETRYFDGKQFILWYLVTHLENIFMCLIGGGIILKTFFIGKEKKITTLFIFTIKKIKIFLK